MWNRDGGSLWEDEVPCRWRGSGTASWTRRIQQTARLTWLRGDFVCILAHQGSSQWEAQATVRVGQSGNVEAVTEDEQRWLRAASGRTLGSVSVRGTRDGRFYVGKAQMCLRKLRLPEDK